MSADALAPDTILVSRSPGESRYALMAGDTLLAVVHRRDVDVQPGAVYLGRVTARASNMAAVFVNIGNDTPGVMPVKQSAPSEGSALAVMVSVPPRPGKGAELKPAGLTIPESAKVPSLFRAAPEPVSEWWARYSADINGIVCTPRREAARVKAMLAEAPVEASSAVDLFAQAGVDEAIEAALRPEVSLPSGGSIIIQSTAALTAIDINAGAADPNMVNAEAVSAIALELRRRNIAGHIMIDMIPTRRRATWPKLLAKVFSPDPAVQVAGLTPLGMVELTRRRTGLSLAETLLGEDGRLSAASIAHRALREAVRLAEAERAPGVSLTAAPEIIHALLGPLKGALTEATDAIKGEISLVSRPEFQRGRIDLRRA